MSNNPTASQTLANMRMEQIPDISIQPQKPAVEIIQVPSLALDAEGYIPAGSFLISKIGLEMRQGATYEDWARLGEAIFQVEGIIQLVVGDWLNYGESFGMTIDRIAEALGREKKTLQNWSWVASKCPLSLRREKLFYGHYSIVSGRKNDRAELLQMAANNGWSVKQLRDYIHGLKRRSRSTDQWKKKTTQAKRKIDAIIEQMSNLPDAHKQEIIEYFRSSLDQL